jgi:hypothetical protein
MYSAKRGTMNKITACALSRLMLDKDGTDFEAVIY